MRSIVAAVKLEAGKCDDQLTHAESRRKIFHSKYCDPGGQSYTIFHLIGSTHRFIPCAVVSASCDTMENQNLVRLFALIKDQRADLLARWRQQVRQLPGAAHLDAPTINDQVPELLDSLADSLKPTNEPRETTAISTEHGLLRWQAGFDVTEVVAEYNILRQFLQYAAEQEAITLT